MFVNEFFGGIYMFLDADKVRAYHNDGYVLLENVYTQAQVDAMIAEIEGGGLVLGL